MNNDFAVLTSIPMAAAPSYARATKRPEITFDSPAIEVMTDLEQVNAVTTIPERSIDAALEHMKRAGVRLLLVTGEHDEVVGLVTAADIQGERPVKLMADSRAARADITVGMIMMPQASLAVLNMVSVHSAQVGHIVATLNHLERQHLLAVEVDQETHQQRIRGIFSTSQISKLVGFDVTEETGAAHSLAELQHQVS